MKGTMRKLVYYVASTIDGYMAGPDGQFDFYLFEGDHQRALMAELPETLPAHARAPLGIADAPNQRFDTVVMGRATYEVGLAVGVTSPYPHLRQYVVSRTLTSPDPDVKVVADADELVRSLKREDGLDIWLCGGGRLANHLLPAIDELIVKLNPVVAGSGIPLFAGEFQPTRFRMASARPFESGLIQVTYARV
jgi:dihydrofolate reductase